MKTQWLDRRIAHPGPYLALCLSEAEFRAAIEPLKPPGIPRWIETDQANATAHFLYNHEQELCVIVCLGDRTDRNGIEIAGLLVHEAVHAWQQYCERIGEHTPGSEQMAYGIQSIAQELLAEYARRIAGED